MVEDDPEDDVDNTEVREVNEAHNWGWVVVGLDWRQVYHCCHLHYVKHRSLE